MCKARHASGARLNGSIRVLHKARLKVDFHLANIVARVTFFFCVTISQVELSGKLFNFNNRTVVHATIIA